MPPPPPGTRQNMTVNVPLFASVVEWRVKVGIPVWREERGSGGGEGTATAAVCSGPGPRLLLLQLLPHTPRATTTTTTASTHYCHFIPCHYQTSWQCRTLPHPLPLPHLRLSYPRHHHIPCQSLTPPTAGTVPTAATLLPLPYPRSSARLVSPAHTLP